MSDNPRPWTLTGAIAARRFDQHVVNNMKVERRAIKERAKQLADRPEVEMGKKDG